MFSKFVQFARGGALVFGLGYGTLRLRYLEGKENRIARKQAAAAKKAAELAKKRPVKQEEGGFFDDLFKEEGGAAHAKH
eukprot:CAMPEP_0172157914 /NCGR_PEP_ID=MMETSP1050-20130122/4075_1 /TAXON_ID=233186 /ORGANISM="Cryptomonas curvata, Strain CCAP979/52" /LENGTH=78 /DNA_ID=CAMNT_0012827235 /DNA_START=1 /DNA_END=237 /DNA_ORIENTATION=-